MIKMKSGVYGTRDMMKRASDGPFSLTDQEEARLVKRGVAEYVFDHYPQAVDNDDPILPKYDVGMTEKQLRGIAAYFCVDVSSARKKQDIVNILDDHFAVPDGDDSTEDSTNDGEPETEGEDADVPQLGADLPTT